MTIIIQINDFRQQAVVIETIPVIPGQIEDLTPIRLKGNPFVWNWL